jgi:hypothetical protein
MKLEILASLVFLNMLATISLWQISARKPEKLKKKFLSALLHSEPITPRHQPPKCIGEGFGEPLVSNDDQLFFADFRDFARVVNWWLSDSDVGGPWRLQELPDTELALQFSDMPNFGRRYSIFYNQVNIGTLEVFPAGLRYSAEKPLVYADIEIEWVRLLSLGTIREFLADIALHVTDSNPNTNEHLQTEILIDRALAEAMWRTYRISESGMDGESYGQLELRLHGLATWYFDRKRAPGLPEHS